MPDARFGFSLLLGISKLLEMCGLGNEERAKQI